jgi:hypothetical protein
VAPILKAYARFKAAKIKEVILNDSVLHAGHPVNNGHKKQSGRQAPEGHS